MVIYNTPSSFQPITALDIKFSRIDSLTGVVIQILPFSCTEENMDIMKHQTNCYLFDYYKMLLILLIFLARDHRNGHFYICLFTFYEPNYTITRK